MATPEEPHRCSLIPRLHRVLSLFHPELLARRKTLARLDQESDAMGLDRGTNDGVRDAKKANVLKTSADPTTVRQTIHSAHRCIGIWRGRHTLTGGRDQPPTTFETTSSPHCLLLSDIHTDRKKLRHLRT